MYEYRDPYIIDFTNVKYYLEMHRVIKKALDFPDYYGENWDALWDCLTDMVGRKIHIEIIGFDVIEKEFDAAAETLIETFRDFKHYQNDEYADDILIEIVDGDKRTVIE